MRKNRGPASLRMWPAAIAVTMAFITSVVAVGCSKTSDSGNAQTGVETPSVDLSESAEDNDKDSSSVTDANGTDDAGNTTDSATEQNTQAAAENTDNSKNSGSADGNQDSANADKATADGNTSGISMEKVDDGKGFAKDAILPQGGGLPAYEYPGPEQFYYVVYDYIANVLGKGYLPGDVTIPCPLIVYEDDSNASEVLLYGDFWVYNYSLNANGTTLMTVSGGSHPGLMHISKTDSGYAVTDFDAVGDGSDFEPTAKRIFGNRYNDLIKVSSDKDAAEATRAQIIANYAAANDLPITGYQDYGWEKRALPTENIDSFYSGLD